ncbi:MAG: polyphosphate kinase 1, partial [Bacteroidota bacterium]
YLETTNREGISFQHMGVGLFNLNSKLEDLIDREVANVRAGGEGYMILKMNSLQDPKMIKKLYAASQAGVKIDLIVRGICSLVPGVAGISDNISGISIVDRYLEHARVFVFHNNGDPQYYISSADWMYRNLNKRIEILVPIYQTDIKEHLRALLQLQLDDNVKARSLDHEQVNQYTGDKHKVLNRSQMETYLYIKRKENK